MTSTEVPPELPERLPGCFVVAVTVACALHRQLLCRLGTDMHAPLQVKAFKCEECNRMMEYREAGCRKHRLKEVKVTKRFWQCLHCSHRFTTLAVVLPSRRCFKWVPPPRITSLARAAMLPSKLFNPYWPLPAPSLYRIYCT
jgi:hypothetical protein